MSAQPPLTAFAGAQKGTTADLDANLLAAASGALTYGGTSTGSANAQAITIPLALATQYDGLVVSFIAGYSNSAAVTLQVNSFPARSLCSAAGVALGNGAIVAGTLYQFRLVTVSGNTHLRKL